MIVRSAHSKGGKVRYGLFEYEDWAEYMTEEEFYALNGQYYSILVGKNILSYEDIYKLIEGLREI